MKTPTGRSLASSLLLAFCLTPVASEAAVLVGYVNMSPTTAVNLTSVGSVNWATWNYVSGDSGASIAPSDKKNVGLVSGNAGFIGSAARVGSASNTTIRGGNASTMRFSYTDGTTTTTPVSNQATKMVFPNALDSANQGVSLTVTGDVGQTYLVSVWAAGLSGQGKMTATLNGATTIELFSQLYGDNGGDTLKSSTLFTFEFRPDNAAHLLNLSYILSTDTPDDPLVTGVQNGNSHVGITAVAVSLIPEASTSFSLIAGLGILGLLRRRV